MNPKQKQEKPRCPKCNVEMTQGKSLLNTLVGYGDFVGDTGLENGCTMSREGEAKLVEVIKCPKCGHSFTG